MMKCNLSLFVLAFLQVALAQVPLNAQAAENFEFSDLRPETISQAIQSAEGYLEGPFSGPELEAFQNLTKSHLPFIARATVVHRYRQAGCARVQIDMMQQGALTRGLRNVDFILPPLQLNLCVDGEPPEEDAEVRRVTLEAKANSNTELKGVSR